MQELYKKIQKGKSWFFLLEKIKLLLFYSTDLIFFFDFEVQK